MGEEEETLSVDREPKVWAASCLKRSKIFPVNRKAQLNSARISRAQKGYRLARIGKEGVLKKIILSLTDLGRFKRSKNCRKLVVRRMMDLQ